MTKREAIIAAAERWARAERRLRDRVNYARLFDAATGEERHRIRLESDAAEENLLKAVEGTPLIGLDEPEAATLLMGVPAAFPPCAQVVSAEEYRAVCAERDALRAKLERIRTLPRGAPTWQDSYVRSVHIDAILNDGGKS